MRIFKKFIFMFLVVGLLLLGCGEVRAQDKPEDNLQFCVDGGQIYFFQPQTGRIFVYRATTKRFSRLLTLEKLGKNLKQSRLLPIVEKEKED